MDTKDELGDKLMTDPINRSVNVRNLVKYYRKSKRPGDDEVMKMPMDSHCAIVIYNLIEAATAVEKALWTRIKKQIDVIYFG